ncbi:MAG TPA: VCBS repeat-containing protein [Opitutus sp.]|nr:VCBS repeat-containing protein [Opitutus sp.]
MAREARGSSGRVAAGVMALALLGGGWARAADAAAEITEASFAARSGPRGATMFRTMAPEETGIVTENRYDDPAMWTGRYAEFALGSIGTGVAIGDYDGDGRPDIFVVSKTESCRLFRNLGGWKFKDVTAEAGIEEFGDAAGVWKQGATFVDVDNDGRLDIYVCRFGAPNRLYLNQGDGTFSEEAAARGLAIDDACVMADFCDYDRDGWLDVFIQTNQPEAVGGPARVQRNYLLHNNGDGTFTDVTERAGLGGRTQGHSAIWWDYDGDGWPDLYVANDFTPADRLYRNNRDGTFTDVIDRVVPHMPFSSMGSDLGDVDNDGRIDLLVADMAATTHEKDQRTMANARAMIAEPTASAAAPFAMRNALYLNTGTGRCREAALLAGLAATDWTWSVRFEDLDNDGRLDLFTTNGMYREPHNADLMARIAAASSVAEKIRLARAAPELREANVAYRNRGDLEFENVSAAWGLDEKGVSFGAAFGDLDGDGDLDLVYANYHKGVTVLRNDADAGHRAIVALRGTRSNRFGVGATVRIETAAGAQVRQLVLARGYLSASEPVLHFGLGEAATIQRLVVEWPGGAKQVFTDLAADRKFTIVEPEDVVKPETAPAAAPPQFQPADAAAENGAGGRAPREDDRRVRAAADFERAGRLGVFVGGRIARRADAPAEENALLANRDGGLVDVTEAIAPGLRQAGAVTAALWSDVDGDGWPDLLLAVKWGSVGCWHNDQGRHLTDWTKRLGFAAAGTGWWSALATADFNGDGRPDYVVGNLGWNTQYRADAAHPALSFRGDFNGDGGTELVEAYYEGDKLYPWQARKELGAAIPAILKRYPRTDIYARATLEEILGAGKLAAARRLAATELRSGVFLSQADGTYRFEPLPRMAQIAPVNGVVAGDFDGDGCADIYAVQNAPAPSPAVGRLDGGLSQLLRGDGRGHFSAVPPAESGLVVPEATAAVEVIDPDGDGWPDFRVTRDDGTTETWRNRGVAQRHSLSVRLRGPAGNPAAAGARVALELADGSTQAGEVVAGAGADDEASACFFGWREGNPPRRLVVRWPAGATTEHPVPPQAAIELENTGQ